MTSQFRTFLAMLLLTVAAAGISGWAGVQYGLLRPQPSADLDSVLHHDLDLTARQNDRIRALEGGFSRDRAQLQAEMRAANRDLADALTKDHAYSPAAHSAVDRFHRAMTALQERTIEHILAMRAVLTPEQAKTFDRTVAKALSPDAS